uniref:7TM_GPCR_Srx domain-containing protein n=1 Tax=Parastrongyloides trichosuri TaxID=131310 RepID=A0A0N4ZQA8_PARTI
MIITLSKYGSQVLTTFKTENSNININIINISFDFCGATNYDDWLVFYYNPVKVILGLISIICNIIFIIHFYELLSFNNKKDYKLNMSFNQLPIELNDNLSLKELRTEI